MSLVSRNRYYPGCSKTNLDFVKEHRVPLKRHGKAEEAGETIKWLLSDQSSFVNGHSLVMDGGMNAG